MSKVTAPVTAPTRLLSSDRRTVWELLRDQQELNFDALPVPLAYEAQVMVRDRVINGDGSRCWLIWTEHSHRTFH